MHGMTAAGVADSGAGPGQPLRSGPFERVLGQVEDDPKGMALLADAALGEMLREYDTEIDRVERQLRAGTRVNAETYTWYRGTIEARNGLGEIRERLPEAISIEAVVESGGITRLLIDGRSVMVDTPRLSGRAELLRRIAQHACELIDCATADAEADRAAARINRSTGVWSFSDRRAPAYEAKAGGVQCLFQDNAHLQLKTQACERLLGEMDRALVALREVQERGSFIDWSVLRILPAPGGAHRIVIDGRGDFLEASLPGLYRLGPQFERVRAWLRASVAGDQAALDLLIENKVVYAIATLDPKAE
jgi:hypothetical protein